MKRWTYIWEYLYTHIHSHTRTHLDLKKSSRTNIYYYEHSLTHISNDTNRLRWSSDRDTSITHISFRIYQHLPSRDSDPWWDAGWNTHHHIPEVRGSKFPRITSLKEARPCCSCMLDPCLLPLLIIFGSSLSSDALAHSLSSSFLPLQVSLDCVLPQQLQSFSSPSVSWHSTFFSLSFSCYFLQLCLLFSCYLFLKLRTSAP